MDEIEDVPNEPPEEEPWCSACPGYTDYRKKQSSVSRADTDGGAYPEIVVVPYCVDCDEPMHYLRHCRAITWSVNLLAALIWVIALLCVLFLFSPSPGSLAGLVLVTLLSYAMSRSPRRSRAVLGRWKRWKEEEGIKELLDRKPET